MRGRSQRSGRKAVLGGFANRAGISASPSAQINDFAEPFLVGRRAPLATGMENRDAARHSLGNQINQARRQRTL